MSLEALFHLFAEVPRGAPGSDAATAEALRRLPALPPAPRVLDLGCGPGRQTLVLARELRVPVLAVDIHEPFLRRLKASAEAEGLDPLVTTRCDDMSALDERPGSVDLIWSEGAIYLLGFREGLRAWRPLLREGGLVVVSELSWLGAERPAEAVAFWRDEYPGMADIPTNEASAREEGFTPLDHFVLPRGEWWPEFYGPLSERIARLRPEADADLAAVLDETEREIALFERYGGSYGYVFYLLRATRAG